MNVRRIVISAAAIVLLAVQASAVSVKVVTWSTNDNYYQLYVDGVLKIDRGGTNPNEEGELTQGQDWGTPLQLDIDTELGMIHQIAVRGIDAHVNTPGLVDHAGFLFQVDAGSGNVFAETGTRYILTGDANTWLMYYGDQTYMDADTGQGAIARRDSAINRSRWIGPPDDEGEAWDIVDGDGGGTGDGNGLYGDLDWTQLGYDDSGWDPSPPKVAKNGQSPWGPISNISTDAYWLWTDDFEDANSSSPDPSHPDTPVFFRLSFTPVPVPEPLTMLGIFLGLGSIGVYIRRRRMR